jgi:hypothetical protein
MIDAERTAGGQFDFTGECTLYLAFNLVTIEQGIDFLVLL